MGGAPSRLRRTDDGAWSATRRSINDPTPVDVDLPELAGALDCDLALCPVTNTMPVLREGVLAASLHGEPRSVELTVAWVDVPSLTVIASRQRYDAGTPVAGIGAQLRFASDDFVEYIEVDGEGIVVSYPSIGHRLLG